jgi:hypothetical protein
LVEDGGPVELDWEDSLDDQLAQASQAIWQADDLASERDPRWDYLQVEMSQIRDELQSGSL